MYKKEPLYDEKGKDIRFKNYSYISGCRIEDILSLDPRRYGLPVSLGVV